MKFKHLMQKGNVNGALKLLTNNMSNGILPLTDETLHLLRTKHPEMQNAHERRSSTARTNKRSSSCRLRSY